MMGGPRRSNEDAPLTVGELLGGYALNLLYVLALILGVLALAGLLLEGGGW